MNFAHLRAILWMRWRVLMNRLRRAGKGSNLVLGIVLILGPLFAAGLFFLGFVLGREALSEASSGEFMSVWLGLTMGFLFFWTGGLVTELQQSDSMSIKALLHLPVSLGWVIAYNFCGTFVSISIALFLPPMLGLALAMLLVLGAQVWLALPLILSFFLMVAALTYQLRGWLARLMENKRRAKTIVAVLTMSFVLMAQLPNLINVKMNSGSREGRHLRSAVLKAQGEDPEKLAQAEADLAAYVASRDELEANLDSWIVLASEVVPVGWLPYGMRSAREGRELPATLCVVGMLGIAAWSLRRSYRKTLDVAMGREASRAVKAAPKLAQRAEAELFVARDFAGLSSAEAGITFGFMRHMLRKPDFKLVFLRVFILLILFAVYLPGRARMGGTQFARSMMAIGAALLSVMSVEQLSINQFGIDRHAFRAMILSPVPRDQILFARNISLAPIALVFGFLTTLGLGIFLHFGITHTMGACLQIGTAFLLHSLLANTVSIHSPVRLMDDGLRPRNKSFALLLRNLFVSFLSLVTLSPLLIPVGLEWWFGSPGGWPLYLVAHAVLLLFAVLLYRWRIHHQGIELQAQEVRILEVLA